jgi:AcrR family transcriptional regulator
MEAPNAGIELHPGGLIVTLLPPEVRRRQIIEAASAVIQERGVAKATTRRIAELAGTTLSNLHHIFQDKEQILEAVFRNVMVAGHEAAIRDVTPGMGIRSAIEAIILSVGEWMESRPLAIQSDLEFHLWSLRMPAFRHLLRTVVATWTANLNQVLLLARRDDEDNADTLVLARTIIGLLDGLSLQWLSVEDYDLKAAHAASADALQRAWDAGAFRVPSPPAETAARPHADALPSR